MKKGDFLCFFIASLIISGGLMGCSSVDDSSKYSVTVTFKSTQRAPRDFDSWSFFWQSPTVDPDSELEYLILTPKGKVYIQKKFSALELQTPGTRGRLDFKEDYAGGDPKVFMKKEVNFTFRARNGDVVFDPNGLYYFKFFKGGFEGTEIAVIDAVSDKLKPPSR